MCPDLARQDSPDPDSLGSPDLPESQCLDGPVHPVVPVKSSGPVPKDKMFECMSVINSATIKAPVKIGDVVIENILGLGVDIVATNFDAGI